jgi:hypothetical protein
MKDFKKEISETGSYKWDRKTNFLPPHHFLEGKFFKNSFGDHQVSPNRFLLHDPHLLFQINEIMKVGFIRMFPYFLCMPALHGLARRCVYYYSSVVIIYDFPVKKDEVIKNSVPYSWMISMLIHTMYFMVTFLGSLVLDLFLCRVDVCNLL